MKTGNVVYTDSYDIYGWLDRSRSYRHEAVNHSVGEYARGYVHINGAEYANQRLKEFLLGRRGVSKSCLDEYCGAATFWVNRCVWGPREAFLDIIDSIFVQSRSPKKMQERLCYKQIVLESLDIVITKPQNRAVLNTATVTIKWYAIDIDNDIDHYELYIDGEPIDTNIPAEITEYTVTLREGTHNITVIVVDIVGNTDVDKIFITIDLTPPIVDIVSPENDTTLGTEIVVEWTANDTISGVDHFELFVDGTCECSYIPASQETYALSLSEGTHNITVVAVDNACNIGFDYVFVTITSTSTTETSGASAFSAFSILWIVLFAVSVLAVGFAVWLLRRKR